MKNILTFGLLGLGAIWLLARNNIGGIMDASNGNGNGTDEGDVVNVIIKPDLRTMIRKAVSDRMLSPDSLFNFHEWNWYYSQVRGIPGPNPDAIGVTNPEMRINIDEYLAMAGSGISGLGSAGKARLTSFERSNVFYN